MSTKVKELSFKQQWIYAIGQLGWASMINVINLWIVYFYIPSDTSGIPVFIPQVTFLVVLNIIAIIAALGRIFDAFTDPWIAFKSDNFKHKDGRRLPFMKWGIIPACIACFLLFFPIVGAESHLNTGWLFSMQIIFYLFLTIYVTPYFALLPEFGHTSKSRLDIATYISITYALGIMVASQVPAIAGLLESAGLTSTKVTSLQAGIAVIILMSGIAMAVPVIFLKEKDHSIGEASTIDFKSSLKSTFKNKHFIYYVVADFSYFLGITIIMTGLLYYITILLELDEGLTGILLPAMVVISFLVYPLVNFLAKRIGKKPLICFAFLLMAINFTTTFFLGKLPFEPELQAWLIVIMMAIPMAFLGVLPNAVLADISIHSTHTTGINQEGMFFAARTLMQKFGQTFGVFLFAVMTTFGKDIGDDLGIRLSAIAGAAFCAFAAIYFLKYNEKEVLSYEQ